MITKQDLQEKYAAYSLPELLEVVENKHNYTDLAVVVAIEEISKRNVTEEQIASAKEEQALEIKEMVKKNYVDRLSVSQKHIFFFLFWFPFLTAAIKLNFAEDGSQMKLKQARYFSWLGVISMVVASLAGYNFNISFWLILIPEFAVTLIFDGVFNPVYKLKENDDKG
jgi:hypothetical protein